MYVDIVISNIFYLNKHFFFFFSFSFHAMTIIAVDYINMHHLVNYCTAGRLNSGVYHIKLQRYFNITACYSYNVTSAQLNIAAKCNTSRVANAPLFTDGQTSVPSPLMRSATSSNSLNEERNK